MITEKEVDLENGRKRKREECGREKGRACKEKLGVLWECCSLHQVKAIESLKR